MGGSGFSAIRLRSATVLGLALVFCLLGRGRAEVAAAAGVASPSCSCPCPATLAEPKEPPPAGLGITRPDPPPAAPVAVDPKLALEALIERAGRAFSESKFDVAVAYLSAAYAKYSLPPILFNIAQAQRKAGRTRAALATYQRFLQEFPRSPLVPEVAAQATAMQARLEAEQAAWEKVEAERRAKERADQAEQLAKAHEAERVQAEKALGLELARKERPVYKRKWFWGMLSGIVGVGVIAGVAVGLSLRPPPEPVGELPTQQVDF